MILTDVVILLLLGYMAYAGWRRGAVLIALELAAFVLATVGASLSYHLLGAGLKRSIGISSALANITAFILAWIAVEITAALLVRRYVLPRIEHHVALSLPKQVVGSVLDVLKGFVLIAVTLVIFTGLPFSPATKQAITQSFTARVILASTGQLQSWLSSGLGRDLGESLNFYTVTAEPKSEQKIDLGFKTTQVAPDPSDEAKMLVLLNHERTSRGLHELSLNTGARQVARNYSTLMLADGYFSHLGPDGKDPFQRMRAGGVAFDTAGENLALAPTLQLAHQGLMNSPGHRANILSSNYHSVGIGIIDAGRYGIMVTQDFTD